MSYNFSEFKPVFFKTNRQRLLSSFPGCLVVLFANGLGQRNGDFAYKFRQESNFWYLSGCNEPDFALVIEPDGRSFLIAPDRLKHRDQWEGAIDTTALKRQAGIDEVLNYSEGWRRLKELIKKSKQVYSSLPPQSYIKTWGVYVNYGLFRQAARLRRISGDKLKSCTMELARLRQIKQPPELTTIQQAIDITTETLTEVKRNLKNYQFEYQIEADITAGFRRRGAYDHAFSPIVAGGINATTIHYEANNAKLLKNDLVILDVGAEVNNYSADITRTFAIAIPTPRQKAVHQAVLAVQQYALSLIKPGVKYKDYELSVRANMAKELVKLKLIKNVADDASVRKYYPNLTSHHMGLDVQDSADYNQPFFPGMVITVEPGIYIPNEKIGVRVEDDILITVSGYTILTKKLPSALV